MDLKLAAVLLLLCATFTISEGGIPKCCLKTSRIPVQKLTKVDAYDIQTAAGVCDISAVILYIEKRMYCGDIRHKKMLKKIGKRRGKPV